MQRRLRDHLGPTHLLAAVLVASAVAGACGSGDQGGGSAGVHAGADGGGGGAAAGSACSADAQCASGHCTAGKCAAGTGMQDGSACVSASECASGACTNGLCGSGGGVKHSSYSCDGCAAFPAASAPACPASTLGAPTIAYPPDGVLLPPNMNVLEVQFKPPAGATLFEVVFSNSVTDVRVETKCEPILPVRGGASTGCGLTLPQGAWDDVASTNRDGDPVHVTVRATVDGQCVSSSTDQIDILFAKEDLRGGIYYWQSATFGGIGGTTGGIYSHDFGTRDPKPTPFMTADASGTCVGCHTLARDGQRMAVMTDDPDADDEMGDVHTHIADVPRRTFLGGKPSPGFQTFTHDHKKMIASTFKNHKNLSWDIFDGETSLFLVNVPLPAGFAATQPDLNRSDTALIYVVPATGTISTAGDHHFFGGSIYRSTYDATTDAMGAPEPLLASDGTVNYYYPTVAPSETFIALNEAADGDAFWNRKARIKLLHYPPASGETPMDLPALNADATIGNSWPRWSPFVQTYKNHKLLWVTFSSNRDYGLRLTNTGFDNCYPPESPTYDQPQPATKQGVGYETCAQPQIWMAAILIDDGTALDAADRSLPAFWLPFQDVTAHNFSAQWVEQMPAPPTMDAGAATAGDGGDASTTPACGQNGASCTGSVLCCSNAICCGGLCTSFASCVQ